MLSRVDRDLGVAFQTPSVNQALSRGEAMDSALLSSLDGHVLEPTECSEGSQASCGVWREDSGLLSSPCRERRPSPRDDRGVSWILSSCGACRKPARDIPLVKKVMRKEARHTQRRDRASGVPPDILEHLPPKPRVCLLYCFVLSPLTLLGAAPHQHLALSVKELTYTSN